MEESRGFGAKVQETEEGKEEEEGCGEEGEDAVWNEGVEKREKEEERRGEVRRERRAARREEKGRTFVRRRGYYIGQKGRGVHRVISWSSRKTLVRADEKTHKSSPRQSLPGPNVPSFSHSFNNLRSPVSFLILRTSCILALVVGDGGGFGRRKEWKEMAVRTPQASPVSVPFFSFYFSHLVGRSAVRPRPSD